MDNRKAQTVAMAMLFETGLGFIGLLVAWASGVAWRDQLTVSQDSLLRGLLACLPMMALLLAFYESNWEPLARLRQEVERVVQELFGGCTWIDLALVSVSAGIGEELLFRGALQPLVIKWTVPWAGVAVVALLFGLAHALTPTYFIAATVIGIYFGWLALAYDDLVAPMVAHAVYDFLALIYVQQRAGKDGTLPPAT